MVSTRSVISKSSCTFINPSVTVPRVLITIGINVTFMFHSFFNSLARSRYLSFFSLSFSLTLWTSRENKIYNFASSLFFFFLIIIRSGRLAEIRWSVCMSKSQRSLYISFSRTDAGLCIYIPFIRIVKFKSLANSQWITLTPYRCLVLYSFCTNLLHFLIM